MGEQTFNYLFQLACYLYYKYYFIQYLKKLKVQLLCIGKTSFSYLDEGIKLYQDRLKHFTSFEMKVVPDIKNPKNMSVDEIKNKEGIALLKQISQKEKLYLLDENGKSFSSEGFAEFLDQQLQIATKQIVFVIGGAFGFSDEVYRRADGKISLSKMTFSHQIIRLIFHEQLYRAYTIINGIPYHNQ